MRLHARALLAAAALAALPIALPAGAGAQDPAPDPAPKPAPKPAPTPETTPEADPMRGPAVTDVGVPAADPGFTGGLRIGAAMGPREISNGLFLRAYRALTRPDTPEPLRASPEQRREIAGLIEAYRAEVRAYRVANVDAYARARETLRAASSQRERTPEQQAAFLAARAEVERLNAAAPKPAAAQRRVLALLTDAQREHMAATIEAMLQARAADRVSAAEQRADRDVRIASDLTDELIDTLDLSDEAKRELRALPLGERTPALPEVTRRDRVRAAIRALEALEGPVSDATLASLELPGTLRDRLAELEPERRFAVLPRVIDYLRTQLRARPRVEPEPGSDPELGGNQDRPTPRQPD